MKERSESTSDNINHYDYVIRVWNKDFYKHFTQSVGHRRKKTLWMKKISSELQIIIIIKSFIVDSVHDFLCILHVWWYTEAMFWLHLNFTDANASWKNEVKEEKLYMEELTRRHGGIQRHLLPRIHYPQLCKPLHWIYNSLFTFNHFPFDICISW